jgi:N-acetylglucosaminyldiphosphoundecaprenol N-acetyl-beta-D-mannosaminyltransferase
MDQEHIIDPSQRIFAGIPFDDRPLDHLLAWYAARNPASPFEYVVTPNVDHVIRLHQGADNSRDPFALAYCDALHRLCDSRILALLARLRGSRLAVVPGSDLTVALFASVIAAGDRVAVVGGTSAMLRELRDRYSGVVFEQHIPPMGLRDNDVAMAKAAAFVEAQRARFVFIGVGSPQQEMLARLIHQRGIATGLGLCVGAAVAFLIKAQSRAPGWMQRAGLEWFYRLLQDPRRLWRRYVVEGPRIFRIAFEVHDLIPAFRKLKGPS